MLPPRDSVVAINPGAYSAPAVLEEGGTALWGTMDAKNVFNAAAVARVTHIDVGKLGDT